MSLDLLQTDTLLIQNNLYLNMARYRGKYEDDAAKVNGIGCEVMAQPRLPRTIGLPTPLSTG